MSSLIMKLVVLVLRFQTNNKVISRVI